MTEVFILACGVRDVCYGGEGRRGQERSDPNDPQPRKAVPSTGDQVLQQVTCVGHFTFKPWGC